jgi:hypothetical protein
LRPADCTDDVRVGLFVQAAINRFINLRSGNGAVFAPLFARLDILSQYLTMPVNSFQHAFQLLVHVVI